MSYRSTKMAPAPVINYAPPIAWLDHHSAEGGVRCDELKRREDESAAEAEMAGDSAAVCRCRCNRAYVQRTLRLLAHEAERARAMDLTI